MTLLSRDEILDRIAVRGGEIVDVPEWGGEVRIGQLTAAEAESLAASQRSEDRPSFRIALLAHCIVDEDGAPVFQEQDLRLLQAANNSIVQRLFDVAMRLNPMGPAAVTDAKKNFSNGRGGASSSD